MKLLFMVIAFRSMPPSMTTAARAGMMPTIERAFTGTVARWSDQPVVEQPVLVVPQALVVHGVADAGEMLEELQHEILRHGCRTG